jgi:hypothetical protein
MQLPCKYSFCCVMCFRTSIRSFFLCELLLLVGCCQLELQIQFNSCRTGGRFFNTTLSMSAWESTQARNNVATWGYTCCWQALFIVRITNVWPLASQTWTLEAHRNVTLRRCNFMLQTRDKYRPRNIWVWLRTLSEPRRPTAVRG